MKSSLAVVFLCAAGVVCSYKLKSSRRSDGDVLQNSEFVDSLAELHDGGHSSAEPNEYIRSSAQEHDYTHDVAHSSDQAHDIAQFSAQALDVAHKTHDVTPSSAQISHSSAEAHYVTQSSAPHDVTLFSTPQNVTHSSAEAHYVTSSSVRARDVTSSTAPPRGDIPSSGEALDLTAIDVYLQTRAFKDYFGRNERLVAVLDRLQNALAFKASSPTAKRTSTVMAFFFLQYFDAKTGSFGSDVEEAFRKTFQASLKPAYVVAAPVRTLLAKFVYAVANRIGHVQDLCKNNKDCSSDVLQRDANEELICPGYFNNAHLHNMALTRVECGEKLLQFILDIAPQRRTEVSSLMQSEVEKFKNDLLECKFGFRELKSRVYSCANVNSVNDYVE